MIIFPRSLRGVRVLSSKTSSALAVAAMAPLAFQIFAVLVSAPTVRGYSQAQNAVPLASRQGFEVVSVKPNTANGRPDAIPVRSGDHVQMHNNQVGSMILYAYQVASYQVRGNLRLPDPWNWYDIDATVAGSPTDDQVRLMFQSLLEDRFKLKVHRETTEMEAYKITVGKNGSKLAPATEKVQETTVDGKTITLKKGASRILLGKDGAHLVGRGATMAQLAKSIEGVLGGPALDNTGLQGTFDYDVVFLPDGQLPATDFGAPTLIAALRTELGLALEKVRAPIEILMIDHLEKPSPN
jgi:uncharacterized protein (TIGR03435 family)